MEDDKEKHFQRVNEQCEDKMKKVKKKFVDDKIDNIFHIKMLEAQMEEKKHQMSALIRE